MRRIRKERDRLLRRIARVGGLSGAGLVVAALVAPESPAELVTLLVTVLLAVAGGALVWVHTTRGSLVAALGVVASAAAIIAILAAEPVIDPSARVAMAAAGGVLAASMSVTLVVRPNGWWLVALLAGILIGTIGLASLRGVDLRSAAVISATGWAVFVSLGFWVDRAVHRAAERIEEVGRAHQAERLASEFEAQQRQDARVLHDTVLATLSLLAHSGVGVGVTALRQQAGDDARLLRQLRLGGQIDVGSTAMFSPEPHQELGATLESVRQRFARMGLDVNWHGAGQLVLPKETLDALLGALGECLENVRRHSGVNEADVTISDDDRTVRAMVSDAGAGFEPDEVDRARLGFAESVVGRLHTVGGRARVFSSPGAGTTVMLEVPKP